MTERTICVVTGSRAEYGHLFWLLREIEDDPDLQLRLVVTGAHLAPRFGLTHRAIEEDGFTIDATVDMHLAGDTPTAVATSMGRGTIGLAEALARIKPHIVVLLGDRYETLSAAQAAMVLRIPIAHIHGGERTEGAMDEAIRHAVTKMAHLHFVSAEPYRRRVIQLGEAPERVFTVGAPGLDHIDRLELLDLEALEKFLGFDLGERYFVVTYHPATLSDADPGVGVGELLAAVDDFADHRIVITGVNADPGHERVRKPMADFADRQPDRVALRTSLGHVGYLSAVKHCRAVIGNSSSGLIEAPALKVPTVNIGDRQRGRLRGPSVVDCAEMRDAITTAIRTVLHPSFADTAWAAPGPYAAGGASRRIKTVLKDFPLAGIQVKRFHDLPEVDCA